MRKAPVGFIKWNSDVCGWLKMESMERKTAEYLWKRRAIIAACERSGPSSCIYPASIDAGDCVWQISIFSRCDDRRAVSPRNRFVSLVRTFHVWLPSHGGFTAGMEDLHFPLPEDNGKTFLLSSAGFDTDYKRCPKIRLFAKLISYSNSVRSGMFIASESKNE